MSELTKKIAETIVDDRDFNKVLRDVAVAFREKGFFKNLAWRDELIQTFKDVVDVQVDDSICITDNEHEISSSFVEAPSKFNRKSDRTECSSIVNDNLFEDSNDSFEIPETQPFPPVYHADNDELDSEGFVTMPDDGFAANDCSQSQVLLHGTEFGQEQQQSPHEPDFEDSDTIDMEMSKLQWDDSTKENDENKSASVTPELDINFMIKQAEIVNTNRNCVTPGDSEFEALPSALTKSIFAVLESPLQPTVVNVPRSVDRNETNNDKSSICKTSANTSAEDDGLKIERIHRQDEVTDDALAAKKDEAADDACDTSENDKENVGEGQVETKEPFKKPLLPNKPTENPDQFDDEMPETQFFFKSDADEAEAVEMPETQLFHKPDEPVSREVIESNHVKDANDVDFEETQLFSKPSAPTEDDDDDVYNVATQSLDAPKNHPSKMNHISLEKEESKDDGSDVDVINVDVASNEISEESKPKIRKRNRLIESSDDEDEDTVAVKTISYAEQLDNDDLKDTPTQTFKCKNSAETAAFGIPTQIFEPKTRTSRTPESPRRKFISDLKGGDWERLCDEANNNQANVVFKSVFDQCKDLRKVQANHVSVASASNENAVAEAPIRQSARSRAKVKHSDSIDAESSKRRKVRIPPVEFKAPSDSISTNPPPLKVEAPKVPSKVSSVPSEDNDTDENVAEEMSHTQVFVKAESNPKERTRPNLPRRQARAATSIEELPEPKENKKLITKLREKNNQSATYSPIPANGKVSSDVNENVPIKAEKSEEVKTSDAVPSRGRKRKAAEGLSLSNDSAADSSTTSRSPSKSRLSRHQSCSVMFTMIDPALHSGTLKKLNISIVETGKYDVLITDKIYRTSKFMCALAGGKPIVSIDWVEALKKKRSMVDPLEFLLADRKGEKKYRFNLAETLDAVQKSGGLCNNLSILVTPSTSPPPDILKDIIVASGGKYLKTSLAARKNDEVLCISDPKDTKLVTQLKKKYRDLKEITVEQFMEGIFQYKI